MTGIKKRKPAVVRWSMGSVAGIVPTKLRQTFLFF
jgi:hypothetical protein